MMSIGIVLTFAGYTVGSYGYVLIRGWDITLRQWVSPFNPWQWPAGDVPTVPQGQIMPGGSPSAAGGSGGNTGGGPVAAPSNPDLQGIPQPGVQGTVAGSHGR